MPSRVRPYPVLLRPHAEEHPTVGRFHTQARHGPVIGTRLPQAAEALYNRGHPVREAGGQSLRRHENLARQIGGDKVPNRGGARPGGGPGAVRHDREGARYVHLFLLHGSCLLRPREDQEIGRVHAGRRLLHTRQTPENRYAIYHSAAPQGHSHTAQV